MAAHTPRPGSILVNARPHCLEAVCSSCLEPIYADTRRDSLAWRKASDGLAICAPSTDPRHTGEKVNPTVLALLSLLLAVGLARADVLCQIGTTCYSSGFATTAACSQAGGTVVPVCPTPGPGTPTPTATPMPHGTQQYCHEATVCWPYPYALNPSRQCTGTLDYTPCAGITPTPTATATATPTPTKPPVHIALTRLPELPWGNSYTQYSQTYRRADGSVYRTSNGGCAAPCDLMPPRLGALGTSKGECLQLSDYASDPPVSHEFGCTGASTWMWEHGHFLLEPIRNLGCAQYTVRPTSPELANSVRDVPLEELTVKFAPEGSLIGETFNWLSTSGQFYIPLGFVDLHGAHYLYTLEVNAHVPVPKWLLMRYTLGEYGIAQPDSLWMPVVPEIGEDNGSISWVGVDPQGKLLALEDAWPPSDSVNLWRSPDEGQHWTEILATIEPPEGYSMIGDCRATVAGGGAVESPSWGICQVFKSLDWSKPGEWQQWLWAEDGADVPQIILKAAVKP